MAALGIMMKDAEYEDEELSSLALRLREELLSLDVSSVSKPDGQGRVPDGAKGLELAAFGALLVNFIASPETLKNVVSTIRDWLGRQKLRTVEITMDGDTLKLTKASSKDQERLVELWVARHAAAG